MAVRNKAKDDPISARNKQQEDEKRRLRQNKECRIHQLCEFGFPMFGELWEPGRHVSGGPVVVRQVLGKSANNESLARDEGGCRNQH